MAAARELCVGKVQNHRLADGQRTNWGDLAVRIARLKCSEGGVNRYDAMGEEALSRSYMIKNFDPEEAHPARDREDLAVRSIKTIGCDRDEVAHAAEAWHRLTMPEILHMRRIKNILTPLQEVLDYLGKGAVRDDLSAWLALIPKLP
ncbi:hypothetical protein [Streptomyces sp. Rer75]|uniref:hypothetical protein n=1 Tax=Streptomyces sp. Rer75 TaxID=2750011 RepID=UPI0015CFF1A3|nr:hypothetical protein [Streptomyces sp. Rer75]QLH20466.1 hypothetical protein HYQ63_07285 [Streptomyces sp. Rer75]